MRQRPVRYTNHKLKKFPLSQVASCLGQLFGEPGRMLGSGSRSNRNTGSDN